MNLSLSFISIQFTDWYLFLFFWFLLIHKNYFYFLRVMPPKFRFCFTCICLRHIGECTKQIWKTLELLLFVGIGEYMTIYNTRKKIDRTKRGYFSMECSQECCLKAFGLLWIGNSRQWHLNVCKGGKMKKHTHKKINHNHIFVGKKVLGMSKVTCCD